MDNKPPIPPFGSPDTASRHTGNVYTGGGDFVGRDKHIYGDEVRGDKNYYVVDSLDHVPLPPDELRAALTRYRQHLSNATQYVKLEGIPLPDADLTGAIPLQRVYIRIQALEQRQSQDLRRAEEQALLAEAQAAQEARRQLDLLDLISRLGEYLYRRGESVESSRRPQPVDPLEAIRTHPHSVLLGAPGSGKSTLLRYLAHESAGDGQAKAAILVPLRDFALAYRQDRQRSLLDWAIFNAAPNDNQLRRALRQTEQTGDVLWLFDGLDETGDLREETSRQVSQLADKAQVVLTSRPLDYRPTHLEHFAHFEALPLTTANVEQFITDWLTILAERQGHPAEWVKACSAWLQQQLATRPRLQTLTQNPLLLTFLVILARHDPRQDLPTRRSDLYGRYIEELFHAWEQRRRPDAIQLHEKLYFQGLDAIAWYLHLAYFGRSHSAAEPGTEAYLPNRISLQQRLALVLRQEGSAARSVDADRTAGRIIDFWINTGLLEERQWGQSALITFRHLTFQEYGVAQILNTAWQKDWERTWRFLRPRLHHFAWREPLLLLAEQMATPAIDQLLRRLLRHPSPYDRTLHRDLYLAATLAGESERASSSIVQQIFTRLTGKFRSYSWLLLSVWFSFTVVLFAIGFFAALQLQRSPWLAVLAGLATPAVAATAVWQSLTVRALLFLPLRPYLSNPAERLGATEALGQLGEIAVEPLLAALKDMDADVRSRAAGALGQLGDGRAVAPLLAALKDQESHVRSRVTEVLGQLGEVAVESLLVSLKDADADVRRDAVEVLGQLGDSRAVEPLFAALKDADADVSNRAAMALGQLGDGQAVEPLLAALKDADADVRSRAAIALGQLGDSRAVELLFAALKDADADVRSRAAEALGQLGDSRAVEPLLVALKDQDADMRRATAWALGKLGDGRAVEPLLAALKDADADVRAWTAGALGELGDSRAVPPLLAALKDQDSDVRRATAWALGLLGDSRAVESLLAALKDQDWFVRWRAAVALGQLRGVSVESLLVALKDADANVRKEVAGALGQLGDSRAVPPLLAALNDQDLVVSLSADMALGQLREVAVEPLLVSLKDADADVRRGAAAALGQLGDERAVGPLLATLKDQDYYVRRGAAKALGQLGDSRAVEPLLAALKDQDADVRRDAAEVLGQLGADVVEPLLAALKDRDYYVRGGAAKALDQLSGRYTRDWEPASFMKIASALWWRLTDSIRDIDRDMVASLSTIVSRFSVTTPIDDLLLTPTTMTAGRRRLQWTLSASLTALLVVAVAAVTGVLGNLLTEWLDITQWQNITLLVAVIATAVIAVLLILFSRARAEPP